MPAFFVWIYRLTLTPVGLLMMFLDGGILSVLYTYPRLSMPARTILPIPATSAPPKRIFSTAGLTVASKRSQLSPSNVNKIIFIYDNEHFR